MSLISYLWESFLNIIKSRLFILSTIFFGLFMVLIFRIFDLQIVNEDYYLNTYVQKAEREKYTPATRGNILDRTGAILAYNKLAYVVTIEDKLDPSLTKNQELNEIIYKTVTLIEKNDDTIIYDFPISLNKNDQLTFSATSETARIRFLKNIYGDSKYLEEEEKIKNASVAEIYDYLKTRYKIIENQYSDLETLKILMIRYNLSQNAYQKYVPVNIATNVSEDTVVAIYENAASIPGISIAEERVRVYNDSKYFAPIIGYTGKISEEQLAEFVAEGKDYINSDIVGRDGIELSMEDYLQGTKGYEKFFADSTGRVISTIEEKTASVGNDVYLTLDRKTQIAAYNILEQKIAGILISKIQNRAPAKKITTPSTDENKKKEELYISIKDVYFQIINNNIVDLTKFNAKKASTNAKNVYQKYASRTNSVLSTLKVQLKDEKSANLTDLSDEYNAYHYYIYDLLKNNNLLLSSKIDTNNDSIYKKYVTGDVNTYTFLNHAISQNWINNAAIEVDEKYTTAQDTYNALVDKMMELLEDDKGFAKLIYQYLIYDGTISGSEVCLLLYDQKVLKYDGDWYNKLLSHNNTTAYNFIIDQIKNLKITPDQLALEPCSGSVVLTDPDNGQVIAMVTYPSYDNNKMSGRVDADYYAKLIDDSSSPLVNRATQTRLAPGSTFKMITAIAGLEYNAVTSSDLIKDTGVFDKVSPPPKCWIYPGAHGAINITKAIGVSCNYFFYETGFRLGYLEDGTYSSKAGLEKIKNYAAKFGLTSKSGVELSEREPQFATDSLVRASIGQDTNAYTNVQLARYVSTLANKGKNYELTLIHKVENKAGEVIYKKDPVLTNTVDIKESTWDVIYNGMKQVTQPGGTVYSIFRDLDIPVACKTGTAQESLNSFSHSVFVAFAPADKPEYGISVYIPNGDSSGYAAEVARDVIKYKYKLLKDKDISGKGADIPNSEITND